MRFRILGTLAVFDGTDWAGIGAAKSRSLLSVLLIRGGDLVPNDQLIFEMWGEDPPSTATTQVHGSVMRIRRLLGEHGGRLLVTCPPGYRLAIAEEDVDAQVFAATTDRGRAALRAGRAELAAQLIDSALAMWRGPALCDVPPTELVRAEASRLAEQRVAAWAARVDADLACGRYPAVIGELRRFVDQNPFRERQWRQLMLALYHGGMRAEALRTFRRLRDVLVDRLGVEPSGELCRLYEQLRVNAPAPDATSIERTTDRTRPPPAQLPGGGWFVGRRRELARLDELLGDAGPAVVAITGPPGAGKSALALHWGNRIAGRFPDGQLCADLRGHDPGQALPATVVLGQFMRALGIEAAGAPSDVDSQAALYRTLLADRRMLVVLDNVASAEQVRTLLPGPSACLTVLTSRDDLRGLLATHGMHCLRLPVLDPPDSAALLAHGLGSGRARAEPAGVAELAMLCGHLPLALRIAAADASAHPHRTVTEQVTELRGGDRLDRLSGPARHGGAVRAAFDVCYRALPEPARRVFRLLGLVPGPDFTADTVAALAGTTSRDAAVALDRLCAAHLVEPRRPARFGQHDLIGLYAGERARAEIDPDEQARALRRMFDHYLSTSRRAAELLTPHLALAPLDQEPTARSANLAGGDAAMTWLDAERANLTAAIARATGHGFPEIAWQLTDALRGYFSTRMLTREWLVTARAGLAAATDEGSGLGRAAMHLSLGHAYESVGEYRASIKSYRRAAARCRLAGWHHGEATALGGQARAALRLGLPKRALVTLRRALTKDREVGYRGGEARELFNIGLAYQATGQLGQAIEYQRQALRRYEELGCWRGRCIVVDNLARLDRMAGNLDAALAGHTEALRIGQHLGWRHAEATALGQLAAVHRDAGRFPAAKACADRALALARTGAEHQVQVDALNVLAGSLAGLGRFDDADACYAEVLGDTDSSGLAAGRVDALLGRADLCGRRGRRDDAIRWAGQALTLAREHRLRPLVRRARTTLAALTR